jgi:hypothetical protein
MKHLKAYKIFESKEVKDLNYYLNFQFIITS